MTQEHFRKNRLFCPGPTPVPAASAHDALQTDIYHRSGDFKEILVQTRELLDPFFKGAQLPFILSSSGTGAMEAAMANLTNSGDEVFVVNGGKFGERWEKLAQAYQCHCHTLKVNWGESPDLNELESKLKENPRLKAFFIQANETSTGVAYPIKEIVEIVKRYSEALVVVDAISALVAQELPMAELRIDCLLSGSQKGFGVPPGLAFISLSEKAWSKLSERPRFYFDLRQEAKGQDEGLTAWTPATSLVIGLNRSLKILNDIGVSNLARFHRYSAEACRAAAQALQLELFSKHHHSTSLTAIRLPESIDGKKLVSHAKEKYGAIFAGGQDQVKGKIIRIAHLGIFDQFDVMSALSAFELSLSDLGYHVKTGAGVAAALAHFSKNS